VNARSVPLPTGLTPPSPLATLAELLLPLDMAGFALHAPSLLLAPRGDGRPVLLLPGFGASERSMEPLARFLSFIGYSVSQWDLGRNRGKVDQYSRAIADQLVARHDQPVTLIGWSLGGVVAREAARREPARVREIITMGTPIIGGPKYTSVGRRFARREALDVDRLEVEVHERNLVGLACPITAIYTDRDGVVSPASSQDIYNPQTRMVKVGGGHFGLGINPRVWRIIADTLANSNHTHN
jgi:pimeloyl-ACP methyl ester carboxylesterase